MRFMKKANNRIWSKAVALLMLCSLVLPMVPTAEAEKIEVKEGKVEIYRYEWINTYEELTDQNIFPTGKRVPVMIAWENTNGEKPEQGGWGDGTLWYAKDSKDPDGNRVFKPVNSAPAGEGAFNYKAHESWILPVSYYTETFFSKEKMGHFHLERRSATDKEYYSEDNEGNKKPSPRFRMLVSERYLGQHYAGLWIYHIGELSYNSSWENNANQTWFKACDWNVRMFADNDKKYNADYRWGNVNFHYVSSGNDDHVKHKGNTMYVSDDGAEENGWDRNFRIYKETKWEFESYVEDITVQDGQTFRINKEMFVPDDVTITVEDGGLCVVNARLALNGQIKVEKGGTLIIEEGVAVCPFANESDKAGSIFIDGGNVLVMEGAKVVSDDTRSKITVNNGGSLINRGLVVARNLSVNTSGRVVNEPASAMALGMSLMENRGFIQEWTIQELYNALEPENLYSSVYLSDGGQLINRGMAKIGGSWGDSEGEEIPNPVVLKTRGTYLCRNEGGGIVDGLILHDAQYTSKMITYVDQWPQN